MKFGDWEFLQHAGKDKNRVAICECQCKCGFKKFIQINALKNGKTKKCNRCRKLENMKFLHVGKKFSMLTVIEQLPGKQCICVCECGNKKSFLTANVTNGQAKSCGCVDSIHRKNYDLDAKQKLFASIEKKANGCWEWKKARHRQGYGHFPYKKRLHLAHRISWLLHHGPIPEGICVLHKCDNPPCCNPDHLFLGTYQTNAIDCVQKGRAKRYTGKRYWSTRKKLPSSEI